MERKAFGALIGAASIVVAVLFVAGFSYRWSYYYNFGLNHLLFGFSVDSVLASAIELIRKPANAAFTIGIVVASLVVVRVVLLIINALARRVRLWTKIKSSAAVGRPNPGGCCWLMTTTFIFSPPSRQMARALYRAPLHWPSRAAMI